MVNILDSLNTEQKKCVEKISGPMIIISGPGSGKTRVITSKIAFLILNNINPSNILSLTFTNKSAKEMINRAQNMIPNHNINNLWIGTFHSVFAKILRIEAEIIGYNNNFTILDNEDSKNIIKRIIKDKSLDSEVYKPNAIFAKISLLKNNMISPQKYNQSEELIKKDRETRQIEFSSIYREYEETCKKNESMDFDSILVNTLNLLNNSKEILEKYQNKFRYTLIDEFQDTNILQLEIIKKIVNKNQNLCVVGDDSQSIYSFRGANINNILNFRKLFPKAEEFKLEQNYRSSKIIVEAANKLIENNSRKLEKKIWTNKTEGEKIKVIETNSDNEEGFIIASAVKHVTQKTNTKLSQNMVLYRMNSQSRAIEEGLRTLGINYRIFGGISFYKRKEIKDIVSYLRFCVNTKDEEALIRIINFPTRGIGNTTINAIKNISTQNSKSMWKVISEICEDESVTNKKLKQKLKIFYDLLKKYISKIKTDSYQFVLELIDDLKLVNKLKENNSIENYNRLENIKEFVNALKSFCEKSSENSIDKFLEEVSLANDNEYDLSENSNTKNEYVSLMTIHQAKGLEFDYVHIVGMEENIFPSQQSLYSINDIEEERRLFYVAITRAKKGVFLSYCNTRFKWGNYIENSPSRFLEEIDIFCSYINTKNKIKHKNIKSKTTTYQNQDLITKKRNLKKIDVKETKINNYKLKNHNLKIGSKISHNIFGYGTIIKIEGESINEKMQVQFKDNDVKTILIRYAKFDLID